MANIVDNEILERELNSKQAEAAKNTEGAMLILAGAGSVLGMFWVSFSRNGIIGRNRKELRAYVKARSKNDKERELKYLAEHDFYK